MQRYGIREVEKLLALPRSTIRGLIDAGFVAPARGPRNTWQFSFQDLIVLRTAQALAAAHVPHRRIVKSLKELRRHLPASMPLSGLRIGAVGNRVVVREGAQQWHADSGQYLLVFGGGPGEGSLSAIAPVAAAGPDAPRAPAGAGNAGAGKRAAGAARAGARKARKAGAASAADATRREQKCAPPAAELAQDWFGCAVELESDDRAGAVQAYQRAIAVDPHHLDAYVNLGRLLHEAGKLAQAERVYRAALSNCGDDATLWFNLGVLLEERRRDADAVAAYLAALQVDPALADGHYNLALLYEQLARPQDAIRHMAQYRRLTRRS